jgi:hypothetical protein
MLFVDLFKSPVLLTRWLAKKRILEFAQKEVAGPLRYEVVFTMKLSVIKLCGCQANGS